jgi:hypothetical protein
MNTDTNTTVTTTAPTTETVKRGPGRPKFDLVYPRGIFTVDELFELNRGPRGRGKSAKVCKLTVRTHIANKVAEGFLTPVEVVKSGKVGQPAKRYIRTAVKSALDAARAARSVEGGTTPAEPSIPAAEVPVEASLVDETPAVPVIESVPAVI